MSDASAPRIFSAEYYERMRRLEAGSWWNAGMRDIAGRLLARAKLPTAGTLIDVGCGSGQTMSWFIQHHPAWRPVGLDISRDGVDAAVSMSLAALVGSALYLPFAGAAADLVMSLDVFQHLPLDGGDAAALREMNRILKPGGALFLRTNAQSFPRVADDPVNAFRKYTPALLAKRLQEAGFAILRMSRANALLGLGEIPRELRATQREGSGYHGILAVPGEQPRIAFAAKRAVLRAESRLIDIGLALPIGRSLVAVCIKEREV